MKEYGKLKEPGEVPEDVKSQATKRVNIVSLRLVKEKSMLKYRGQSPAALKR